MSEAHDSMRAAGRVLNPADPPPKDIPLNPIFENGQRWMVVKRPEELQPHKCKLPGRWVRFFDHIKPGTVVRCLDCDRYWSFSGANAWEETDADGWPIPRLNFGSTRSDGDVPPGTPLDNACL